MYLYLAIIAAFVIDTCSFFLLEGHFIHTQLILFIVSGFKPQRALLLCTQAITLCLASLLFAGSFGYALTYLLPAAGAIALISRFLYPSALWNSAVLAGALGIHHFMAKPLFLGITPQIGYTIVTIIGNIVMCLLFSLAIMFHGKRGDRS